MWRLVLEGQYRFWIEGIPAIDAEAGDVIVVIAARARLIIIVLLLLTLLD